MPSEDVLGGNRTCAMCGTDNAVGAATCKECRAAFPPANAPPAETTAQLDATASSVRTTPAVPTRMSAPGFEPGHRLGTRYTLLKILGRGAFGDVYLARDAELGRDVALKVLRAEVAASESVVERFKHEILLSSQVTSKHVLRVYDVGQADGVKFLTMQYVDGQDLAAILKQGRVDIERAVTIFRQICHGVAAAHEQKVIHRDLKPQNVLVDAAGRTYVTDFGLAKVEGESGMTKNDQVIGTPSYMSPEQVKGEKLDQRSDIYALGVMLYELVTGVVPFREGNHYEVMMQRLSRAATPARDLNPNVPVYLAAIIDRCLAVDRDARYAQVEDVLADLDAAGLVTGPIERTSADLTADRAAIVGSPAQALASMEGSVASKRRSLRPRVAAACAGGAIVAGLAWWKLAHTEHTQAPAPTGEATEVAAVATPRQPTALSVLIADFTNRTGDTIFDGTLEPALGVALEGASFLRTYNRNDARAVLADLRPDNKLLDGTGARLVASREGINVVVTGEIERHGSGYTLHAHALDAATGREIRQADGEAHGKTDVIVAASRLAIGLREALGDTTPESVRAAAAETVSTRSLEALQAYLRGQQLSTERKDDAAIAAYQEAIRIDPAFGRAYSGLGVVHHNRRQEPEARAAFEQALKLLDRMTEREKLRTLGAYYNNIDHNYRKAVEVFETLVKAYPADDAAHANLGFAYVSAGDIPHAIEQAREVLKLNPRSANDHYNLAIESVYVGDLATAVTESEGLFHESPTFELPYLPLALAKLLRGDLDGARAAYDRVEKVSADGAALARLGRGDLLLYQGKYREAAAQLEHVTAAAEYVELAEARLAAGQPTKAIEAAHRATALGTEETVRVPAALVLVAAGRVPDAEKIAAELEDTLEVHMKAYAQVVRAAIAIHDKKYPQAVELLRDSFTRRDTWLGRFLLARLYVDTGRYTEALGELEICTKRYGETGDMFVYDLPTARYLPPLYYYLGRVHEALGMATASEHYDHFLAIRRDGDPDPLVIDAKRRRSAPSKPH